MLRDGKDGKSIKGKGDEGEGMGSWRQENGKIEKAKMGK